MRRRVRISNMVRRSKRRRVFERDRKRLERRRDGM